MYQAIAGGVSSNVARGLARGLLDEDKLSPALREKLDTTHWALSQMTTFRSSENSMLRPKLTLDLWRRCRSTWTLCGTRYRDIAPLVAGSPTGGKHQW